MRPHDMHTHTATINTHTHTHAHTRRNRFKSTLELLDGVSMGYLNERSRSFLGGFTSLFASPGAAPPSPEALTAAASAADVFIVVNVSTVELADVERYANDVVRDRPLLTLCMELDTLRADLGVPCPRVPRVRRVLCATCDVRAACVTCVCVRHACVCALRAERATP